MRVLGQTVEELATQLEPLGHPKYRAEQVFQWLHAKNVQAFREMTNLPKDLRETLEATFEGDRHSVEAEGTDEDARKLLLRLGDGECVEAVLMGRPWGDAACLSSQVGCPVGCRFCASGQDGLVRGLRPGEIIAQLAELRRQADNVSHVVFMGMGEPLFNLDSVIKAIELISDSRGMGLSQKSITISTIGILPGLVRLAESDLRVRLTLSLHATEDKTRAKLIPNWCAPIDEIVRAGVVYSRRAGRRLTLAYVMMAGVNDTRDDVRRLAEIALKAHAHVNIIPYNEVEGTGFVRPGRSSVGGFLLALEEAGVRATVRVSVGRRADAACGQLRARRLSK